MAGNCGTPQKYPGVNPYDWDNEFFESETFQKVSSKPVQVIIAVLTLMIAIFTLLKK